MSVEVIWTETAKKTLEQIKIYLIDSFTETEFQKLKKAINENINLIKKGVVQHKYFEKTNCCRVIILKKSNPSGLLELDDELRVPVRF